MRRARGITLVEALVGTLLMGSLLVGIIVTGGRVNAQRRLARNRIEACDVLSDLLQQWWAEPEMMPRDETGEVFGREGWRWRTSVTTAPEAEELDAEIVAVEVFAPQQDDEQTPGARVELLLLKVIQSDDQAAQSADAG